MDYIAIETDRVVHVTDDAVLFEIDGDQTWIPKSLIEDAEDIEIGDEDVEINVAEWFAEKEGLG